MKVICPRCSKAFGVSHKGLAWLSSVACRRCGTVFTPVFNQQPGHEFERRETRYEYQLRHLNNAIRSLKRKGHW